MTNREDPLDEVRASKEATVVSTTGQVVPVRGEGRAMFMGADGRLVGLKRVLLVPGLCANLLSTKALSEAGMKVNMMGTKVFKATLDGRVLWDLRGGKDMHRSMWEIPVLPWKDAAARLAAEAVRGGHASHVTCGGGGDGSDGGLLVHGGGALPSVSPSTGEKDWLTAHRRFGHVALPQLQELFKEERVKGLRIKGEPKILHASKIWRCYLTDAEVTVRTDHKSLQYLRAQPHLNPRQVRWLAFLEANFHYTVTYKKRASNIADELTRPTAQLHAILLAQNSPLLTGLFTLGYQTDPFFSRGNSKQFAVGM
ncbi:unnamed protein product [Closterium sp. NIES-53]